MNLTADIEIDSSSEEEEVENEEVMIRNFEAEAQLLKSNLLPQRSKKSYIKAYDNFMAWMKKNGTKTCSGDVFLVYFNELSKCVKPPSLWSIWSKLKTTLNLRENVKIDSFLNLKGFIKEANKGYRPKKSNTIDLSNLNNFMKINQDSILAYKVVAIVGYFGCLRSCEIFNLKLNNFQDADDHYVVWVLDTKTFKDRNFVIGGEYYKFVKNYRLMRPKDLADEERFFVTYQKGRCIKQFIGKNKIAEIPRIIATSLNLPNPDTYTGHSFRRSSATVLSNSEANLATVKNHGGWESDKVAQGYIDVSTAKKKEIFGILATPVKPAKHSADHPPINVFSSHNTKDSIPEKGVNAKYANSPKPSTSYCSNLNQPTTSFCSNSNQRSSDRSLRTDTSNDSLKQSTSLKSSTDKTSPSPDKSVLTEITNNNSPKLSTHFNHNDNSQKLSEIILSDKTNSIKNSSNSSLITKTKKVHIETLADDYDDVLSEMNLENIEVQSHKKRDVPAHSSPPQVKRIKSNPRLETKAEDDSKLIFKNCEIHNLTVNNYYYSQEK